MSQYCLIKTTQHADRRQKIIDHWFDHCETANIPYICLTQRGRRSDIHWNYTAYPLHGDEAFTGESGERLRLAAKDVFANICFTYRDTKIAFMATGQTIDFEAVPNRLAENLAKEIYSLVSRHYLDWVKTQQAAAI